MSSLYGLQNVFSRTRARASRIDTVLVLQFCELQICALSRSLAPSRPPSHALSLTLAGDTDKKPREMPERMKELVMQQGMSQRMVCTVAPSHPMLRKWMAARNLLPTKSFAFAPTVALVRRATVQALIKAPSHAAGASADTSDTIQSQEEAARAMFESIDKNGDGRLDEEELLAAFPFLDRAQVDALMQAADANSDGYMSFDELWALIQADQIGGDDAEADAHRPQTTGSDDINEVRQIFSPVRFETQAFQLGEEAMIDQIQDPEASLAKLYERVAALFDDFDVTESGTLGRIELAMGLEDYGYLEVERDIVFHVMDHNNDGKITFPNFFRSIWVMSEHVLGLSQLLSESYGEDINEDGLRRVLDFLRPRVVTLQRKFRQMRRERRTQQAQEAKETTGSETAKDRRSKDSGVCVFVREREREGESESQREGGRVGGWLGGRGMEPERERESI